MVLTTNAVPETMRLHLRGEAKDYVFTIEPCRDCTFTDDVELGAEFCDRAPQQALYVEPGEYEVVVSFVGATSHFRSDWNLKEKWQYDQCIFAGTDWGI